ncbi:MAG TPA: type II toxin-antitoxin system VapC family toxin [Candidatus Polarisedimenticolia bacterium]|nr:type II toxin-antitoxin system VapC family toxin [Candidatus Polarisedimenticolia bacterium]
MKFIADTHAFIWFITDSSQLSAKSKALLESPENERLLSTASIWEIAIKASLGKLSFKRPLEQLLPEQIALNYFQVLDVSLPHALRIASLPMLHRDPFDRMLIAQALTENLPILSSDNALDAYGIQRIW